MLQLSAALATRKYWKNAVVAQAEKTVKISVGERLSEIGKLNPDTNVLLDDLRRDGITLIPGYWSAEKCATARAELDRLIGTYPQVVRRFSGNADKRMFGVEMASPVLASFHDDPFLQGIGEALGGMELYNFCTLGARIDADAGNNGSGDGWHRDGFAFQFKSIIYLSNVSDDNGPFEYLPKSHKLWRTVMDTAIGGLPAAPDSRLSPEMIDRLVARTHVGQRRYSALAGTLILVNTAGIHRGAPLRQGNRYSLTNYFYHPYQVGEELIEKFSPLLPGTAERTRKMLAASARSRHS